MTPRVPVLAVAAMVVDPGSPEDLLAEAAGPFLVLPVKARIWVCRFFFVARKRACWCATPMMGLPRFR